MAWQKGFSGNPGGRPKTKLYSQAVRELLASPGLVAPESWGTEETWSKAQKAAVRDYGAWQEGTDPQAAGRFLDRAEGKPAQAFELEGSLGLHALQRGLEPEAAERINRDPSGTIAALVAADIGNGALRWPHEPTRIVQLLFSSSQVRRDMRALLERYDPPPKALPPAPGMVEEEIGPQPPELATPEQPEESAAHRPNPEPDPRGDEAIPAQKPRPPMVPSRLLGDIR